MRRISLTGTNIDVQGRRQEAGCDSHGNSMPLTYETRCALCSGRAFAIGGASLWCLSCLEPYIEKGLVFQPRIQVVCRREAVPT